MDSLTTWLGWYGMGAVLTAYTLNSFDRLRPGVTFYTLNLTGAIGLSVCSLAQQAYPVAALNIAWAVVAFVGLIRCALFGAARRTRQRDSKM